MLRGTRRRWQASVSNALSRTIRVNRRPVRAVAYATETPSGITRTTTCDGGQTRAIRNS